MPKPEKTDFTKYEDWTPPWGDDFDSVDPEKLHRLVYNLQAAEHDAKQAKEIHKAELSDRDEAIAKYRDAEEQREREGETEADKLRRENEKLKADKDAATAATARENDLLKVRLETGLTEKQVKRLVGNDFDELLADAKELAAELKPANEPDPDDEEEDEPEGGNGLQRQPARSPLSRDDGGRRERTVEQAIEQRGKVNPLIA